LYVDRLAPILRARTGHSSIADMFLPALRAGELSLIAECDGPEFEQLTSKHPVLASAFYPVKIHPTPSAAMPAFLRDYQARVNPRLVIEPPALRQLVQHLDFFQRDTGFPGKGVRFLDWLNKERGEVTPTAGARPPALAEGEAVTVLDEPAISSAFARATGLPIELISEAHVAGPEQVAARLQAGVIGQDEACRAAARVLTRFKAGLNDAERPIGSLFFVGPTGVGKTELAKQLARYMFGDPSKMIRVDMSEYMLPGASQRLLAVGHGVRSLVERVRVEPLSLVLLDEIEKAHAEVFDLLLAMLGEGRMTDVEGRLVDFRMTLIVMTSNLGVRRVRAAGFGDRRQTGKELLGAVRAHFRPEFFNRVDHVLAFRNLAPEDILKVVDLELAKAGAREGFRRRDLRLEVDQDAREALARMGWHPSRGARPLKRVIEERVVSPLAVRLAGDTKLGGRRVYVVLEGSAAARRLGKRGELVIELPAE
ncbi:MAG: ATP-dependent Clp protease ATP-binding subunit, partial [Myxococcales bacterium]|nr:ATP-dependent Clp protease ATP-binding subunit [Myxococcales bacterium]